MGERGGGKDTQIHRYTAVYVKVCVVDIYIEREISAQKSLAPS